VVYIQLDRKESLDQPYLEQQTKALLPTKELYLEKTTLCREIERTKSPPFHTVICIHLISLSYHILVMLLSHFSSTEHMLMLMLIITSPLLPFTSNRGSKQVALTWHLEVNVKTSLQNWNSAGHLTIMRSYSPFIGLLNCTHSLQGPTSWCDRECIIYKQREQTNW